MNPPGTAQAEFRDGDILVIDHTTNDMLPLLKRAGGIITQQDGMNSHGAIVGLSLDIPVIIGAKKCDKRAAYRRCCNAGR